MKVALIGGCGHIGSLLYSALSTRSDIVLDCYDRSPPDVWPPHIQKETSMLTKEDIRQYEVVLYFVGICKKQACEEIPYSALYERNVLDLVRLLNCLEEHQLCIYASTAALYKGTEREILWSENTPLRTECLPPYERSMLERELAVASTGKRAIGLRLGSVVGLSPNMKMDMFYHAMLYQALFLKSITAWNVSAMRAVLWQEDLATAITCILENRSKVSCPTVFNLCSFNCRIEDILEGIIAKTGAVAQVITDNDPTGFQISIEQFTRTFGFVPSGTPEQIWQHVIERKLEFGEYVNNLPKENRKRCVICSSAALTSILDLGCQPLANNLLVDKHEVKKYPLELLRCMNCHHTQLSHFVNREVLFKHYLYESGVSQTAKNHFKSFASHYSNLFSNKEHKTVLEIACNDGSQLDEFKALGWTTYGVEPATNIYVKGVEKGHAVAPIFWGNYDTVDPFRDISYNLIVAQNVFAHVTNPIDFLRNCYDVMTDDTLLVIQTSQANMYIHNEFDTIYHEHISFFTIRSMIAAAHRIGCIVTNVYKTSIHGTSYTFELMKGTVQPDLPLLQEEIAQGLYENSRYMDYRNYVHAKKSDALLLLNEYAHNGYHILGYGAAAKGNVFLNYIFDSKPHQLAPECIIDESNLKIGRYTPSILIPVKDISVLHEYSGKKVLFVILAWNFKDEIIQKIRTFIETMVVSPINPLFVHFFPATNILR